VGVKWESKKMNGSVWRGIFEAKYTVENALGKALIATMPLELVEFDRGPKRAIFWGGKLVDGLLVGANTMGVLLQERRSDLLALAH
jgi:predicted NAD-dependent protein-ADP-ribosyltransferase YbiA (DUF1768 family)